MCTSLAASRRLFEHSARTDGHWYRTEQKAVQKTSREAEESRASPASQVFIL